MITAAVLLAIAALGGLAMALIRLSGKPWPPLALAVLHGLLAVAGVIALIVALANVGGTYLVVSLIGFVLAALGGLLLFSFHMRAQSLPIPLVFIHGAVAIVSFVVLLIAIFAKA
jgi:hypothetical protein